MIKILIALDNNDSAALVAETGYAMARAMHASVILAHVIAEPPFYSIDYSPITGYQGRYTAGVADRKKDAWEQADAFLSAIAARLNGSNVETVVLEGNVEDAILDAAERMKAGMIVMGSHRHHGLDRILQPDVAVHVLMHARIPLVAIPTHGDRKEPAQRNNHKAKEPHAFTGG